MTARALTPKQLSALRYIAHMTTPGSYLTRVSAGCSELPRPTVRALERAGLVDVAVSEHFFHVRAGLFGRGNWHQRLVVELSVCLTDAGRAVLEAKP